MAGKVKKMAYLLLSLIIALIIYIILHEFGHMIVMLSAGATITDFSVVTAHVSGNGGNYSTAATLWLHANGAVLPVIIAFIYMLFYRKKTKNTVYIVFSYVAAMIPVMALLAWVIIPFVYMQGNAPVGEDVTKFLVSCSQNIHPLIVSAVAAIIIIAGIVVMICKGIIKNFFLMIREQ